MNAGDRRLPLALDALRLFVPSHCALSEVRLIRHVARQSGVVAEDSVLYHGPPRPHRLEIIPQVWFHFVPGSAAIAEPFHGELLARRGVALLVPFLDILLAHRARKT